MKGGVGLGAGAHSTGAGDAQHPHHLGGTVGGFRLAKGFAARPNPWAHDMNCR